MEQGWDPEVKKYFVKILNSISIGLLWLMAMVTAGLYFQLGYRTNKPAFFNVLEHLGYASNGVLLFVWCWLAMRSRKANAHD